MLLEKFENLLFDFDGTIMDTSEGIFHSFDYVEQKLGLTDKGKDFYPKLVGPPLAESFSRFFGLAEDEIQNAIKVYREYYKKGGMFEGKIYDGFESLLKSLKSANKKLFVATSKPEIYARQILSRLKMDSYFDFIGGSDTAEKDRIRKVDVIRYVMKENSLFPQNTVMIGDRFYDIEGAQQAGIASIGVLWGFGSEQELKDAGANVLVSTPQELLV